MYTWLNSCWLNITGYCIHIRLVRIIISLFVFGNRIGRQNAAQIKES